MNKRLFAAAALLAAVISLTACTTSVEQHNLTSQPAAKLLKNKTVYITPVADGVFNGKVYTGSGMNVANMFAVNMTSYISKSVFGGSDNFAKAKAAGAYYVVKATILHWEPRAAAWSGIPTKLKINVAVYSASDGEQLINRNLEVKGRAMTFANQSVEGLADIIIKQFCQDVF